MRHSDPRITLGLYRHVVPQSLRDAVSSLAARLGGQLRLSPELLNRLLETALFQ